LIYLAGGIGFVAGVVLFMEYDPWWLAVIKAIIVAGVGWNLGKRKK
jgi:hypothetical protein